MTELPQNEKKIFIREKIVKRPLTFKEWLFRVFTVIMAGVFFGIAACITFLIFKPLFEKKVFGYTPMIKENSSLILETEQMKNSGEEIKETESKDEIDKSPATHSLNLESYSDLNKSIVSLKTNLEKSLVKVTSTTIDTDWFDNSYEKEGIVSGIILDITKEEVSILTDSNIVKNTDGLEVTFISEEREEATVKAVDQIDGIAIISVPTSNISEITQKKITIANMKEISEDAEGEIVLSLGCPTGALGSAKLGIITYIDEEVQSVDAMHTCIDTDISVKGKGNSYLFDVDGHLIGIYQTCLNSDIISKAIAVSSIFKQIKSLQAGYSVACLGIYGQTITQTIAAEYDLPYGIYITKIIKDKAAYNTGLQNGDVIVKVNGKSVIELKNLESELANTQVGKKISVTVKRKGNTGYQEIKFTVILDKR